MLSLVVFKICVERRINFKTRAERETCKMGQFDGEQGLMQ